MNQPLTQFPNLHLREGRPVTTSLDVATTFGKQHNLVMRAIRNLECSDSFRLCNFAQSSYLNEQNKPQPMHDITRDGFSFLAMGFTGANAARWKEAYINAFNQMEAALRQTHTHIPSRASAAYELPRTRFALGKWLAELKSAKTPAHYQKILATLGLTTRRANDHILFYQFGQRFPGLREWGEAHFSKAVLLFRTLPDATLESLERQSALGGMAAITGFSAQTILETLDAKRMELLHRVLADPRCDPTHDLLALVEADGPCSVH